MKEGAKMYKLSGIFVSLVMLLGMGLSVARAENVVAISAEYRLADTPTKYGFRGLHTLFSPETYVQGKFGIGVYWDMTQFCWRVSADCLE